MLNAEPKPEQPATGIAEINCLFEQAVRRHGSDLEAVLKDVRKGVAELAPDAREKALAALSLAVLGPFNRQ